MRRECRDRFSRHSGLAIPTCITARAWRTCRDACRDRWLVVSFEVGSGENVPGIPGACATLNFTYLVRGPWISDASLSLMAGLTPLSPHAWEITMGHRTVPNVLSSCKYQTSGHFRSNLCTAFFRVFHFSGLDEHLAWVSKTWNIFFDFFSTWAKKQCHDIENMLNLTHTLDKIYPWYRMLVWGFCDT